MLKGKFQRVIIENVEPRVNCGDFPVKRTPGEKLIVRADIFCDGHDEVRARFRWRKKGKRNWNYQDMEFLGNDRWRVVFVPDEVAVYEYSIEARIDHFKVWQKDLKKRADAGQDLSIDLKIGAEHIREVLSEAHKKPDLALEKWLEKLEHAAHPGSMAEEASGEYLYHLVDKNTTWKHAAESDIFRLSVERSKALFSTWYELFPRSASPDPERPGTFRDVEALLPRIAEMGFDVLYLPPIHPIGRVKRKGRNNALSAKPGDPGSPWAIGAEEGGHKSIHPELGDMDDFQSLIRAAKNHGIEIALDIAFQCSPDHPYIYDHPEWFKWRPDGTIQYAENPPKKYEDIVPFHFETEKWKSLWNELKSVIEFWVDAGISIFRIDNPHTKPFEFWEWMIREVRKKHPDAIFLSEAFTRPRPMEWLAKTGFSQSYTYFTWRNTKAELTEYIQQLSSEPLRNFYRPNFWPNTPDILSPALEAGEPAFITRVVLAGTMSSNYGLYGPVYEFGIYDPMPDKEEYHFGEKYEVKHWDWDRKTKIRDVITKLNEIRRENPALQTPWHVQVVPVDNPLLFAFAKTDQDGKNPMLMVVNLDNHNRQSGWLTLPLKKLRVVHNESFVVHDLLTGDRYSWQGEQNYVELDPAKMPVHVFKLITREGNGESLDAAEAASEQFEDQLTG